MTRDERGLILIRRIELMRIRTYIENRVIPHRRGIMGTVIFHLLLAILFLGMGISKVVMHSEMEIVMETPEPERIQEQNREEERKKEIRQKSSAEEVERMLRSIAVNENIKERKNVPETNVDQYVDEIMRELQENGTSGRYKALRDKNFRRDSLLNARDRQEQRLDSL
ncbi:MAG: energy transducer TonB, partial [Odoribacter sp.]|nr:energy transducer TonB [Odoribacter sp.]